MFNHLIESGSHKKDLARKGRFFLGTLGFYTLLLLVAGVASVYAYDSHLAKQNLELYTLVALPPEQAQPQRTDEPRRPASSNVRNNQLAERPEAIARLLESTRPPDTTSTVRNTVAEMPRVPFIISSRTVDPADGGGALNNLPGVGNVPSNNRNNVVVRVAPADDPEPPRATPTPAPVKPPDRIRVASSVISSKIITKPAPPYPIIAKQARAQGPVTVEILIDEQGRVVSAHATSGHPLLRAAAQQSAYQARFSPTSISGQPVKVSGVITYNFILQ
ncbi:MAG TPA: energy transducer TonB [Pyrinomonadaceae bacterium]|nr:energy transducer TonB [Pyrinomonadaceae bacterium]